MAPPMPCISRTTGNVLAALLTGGFGSGRGVGVEWGVMLWLHSSLVNRKFVFLFLVGHTQHQNWSWGFMERWAVQCSQRPLVLGPQDSFYSSVLANTEETVMSECVIWKNKITWKGSIPKIMNYLVNLLILMHFNTKCTGFFYYKCSVSNEWHLIFLKKEILKA